jgi:hypothetical protein
MPSAGLSRRHLLLVLVVLATGAHAAPPGANLSLQWRLVPWPPAPVVSSSPGSVTVSTTGGTGASNAVTTHTATSDPPPQRLLLRNGGEARIALLRDTSNDPPDLVWTPQGQGVASARGRRARQSLWVQVQWPGGSAPATLAYRFEQPMSDPGRADASQQLDGQLLMRFDQWVPVGHWAGPDGAGQGLELRVGRLP